MDSSFRLIAFAEDVADFWDQYRDEQCVSNIDNCRNYEEPPEFVVEAFEILGRYRPEMKR